jgi:predicted nucleic acid-binding protein
MLTALEGVYHGRDPNAAEAGFRQFSRLVDVLPLNKSMMRLFARIRGELRRAAMEYSFDTRTLS